MGVFLKAFIFLLSTYLLVFPTFASGEPRDLIGVVPFTNQRSTQSDNWIGFYIQARLRAYLQESLQADFYPLETIRLWRYKSNQKGPVSKDNSIIISGSFQQVLSLGVVKIRVQWFKPQEQHQDFSIHYHEDSFEKELDTLFLQISQWIEPKSKVPKTFNYPSVKEDSIEPLFRLRQTLFSADGEPEIKQILQVKELVTENSRGEFIADLTEGMLILSKNLLLKEKEFLLQEIESLLRTAAARYNKNSRIHGLLAEVYYLSHKKTEWVLKTAEEALKTNPYNSLALLMRMLASEIQNSEMQSHINKMYRINPWIWPDSDGLGDEVQFQKGLFRSELLQLIENSKKPDNSNTQDDGE